MLLEHRYRAPRVLPDLVEPGVDESAIGRSAGCRSDSGRRRCVIQANRTPLTAPPAAITTTDEKSLLAPINSANGDSQLTSGIPARMANPPASPEQVRALEIANQRLRKKIEGLAPSGSYLVVDTGSNRVYLRKGEETLREMVASCGR